MKKFSKIGTLLLTLSATSIMAQGLAVEDVAPKRIGNGLSYAAKFLCGISGDSTSNGSVINGLYRTTINIHNPNNFPVTFLKKSVLAEPQGQPRGKISAKMTETLQPDEALQVNCRNIEAMLGVVPFYIDGFVVIESPRPLDIRGVYTSMGLGT